MTFRFHVLGLPFTQTHRRHGACAFTTKIFNFCKMMHAAGHEVIHYGAEESDPPASECVTIMSAAEQRSIYGERDNQKPYNESFDASHPGFVAFNTRGAAEILKRSQPRDFVCIMGGTANRPLADLVAPLMVVEHGIGYLGSFAKYRVFESYAHMHGQLRAEQADPDGRAYWGVVPNYFDVADFPFCPPPSENTFGYLGRIIQRKGVSVAAAACQQLGAKLLVAGTGATMRGGKLAGDDGMIYEGDIEHLGHVNQEQRIEFFRRIRALFVPTLYVEPYGSVAAEAQLCGVPVIASDWGGMVDSVEHGRTGYRCHTLKQFVAAAACVNYLDRDYIWSRARRLWSLEVIARRYEEYFLMLTDLWAGGWYEMGGEPANLGWLLS